MANFDFYTQSFATYKMKPKYLINDLIMTFGRYMYIIRAAHLQGRIFELLFFQVNLYFGTSN